MATSARSAKGGVRSVTAAGASATRFLEELVRHRVPALSDGAQRLVVDRLARGGDGPVALADQGPFACVGAEGEGVVGLLRGAAAADHERAAHPLDGAMPQPSARRAGERGRSAGSGARRGDPGPGEVWTAAARRGNRSR